MTPMAAKLLMCVCAGSTGAAIIPVAHKARSLMRPRPAVHRSVAAKPIAAAALPCIPASVAPAIAGGGGEELAPSALTAFSQGPDAAAGPGGRGASSSVPFDDDGGFLLGGGRSAGTIGGGGGGGGIGGAPGAPGLPASPPVTATPTVSAAPEPTSWVLMVTGFGLVGGGLRWHRRVALA